MSPVVPTPIPSSFLRLGIFAGWLLFMLMVIAISWIGGILRGQPISLATVIWNLGWLFWAGATFLVAWLARRFPLDRPRLALRIGLHAGFGLALGAALLGLEFLLAHALRSLWPAAPRPTVFLGFIVYKFHVYFLIYWMILGATRAYDFYAKYRASEVLASQLEARLAHAQLHALKTQLHPHFLFNTHHAIISLMLKQDNTAAIKMLTRLSDLLRVTLRTTEQQVTSLREELATLDLYLGIQRERFADRLRVEFDVAPAALSAEVPWLLLQPLVENALQHGIDPLPAGGVLRLRASVTDDRLDLVVSDNGAGLPSGFTDNGGTGIGLRNTRERLARLYGEAGALRLARNPAGGTDAHVALPFRIFQPAATAAPS